MQTLHLIVTPTASNKDLKTKLDSISKCIIFVDNIKDRKIHDISFGGTEITLNCGLNLYVSDNNNEISKEIERYNNEEKATRVYLGNDITCFWYKSDTETILIYTNSYEASTKEHFLDVLNEFKKDGGYIIKPL